MTLTQCIIYENKVKKFFKKLLDKLLNQCYSIIAVSEQKKFKAKMNYADKTGVPYVVFLGEDEVKNNVIACKDMTSGEQTTLDFAATLARIRDGLAERNKGKVIVEK